jgi:type IV secretory pathway TraG/TraD family ATPase VirD4
MDQARSGARRRRGDAEVRDVQNVADILVDTEGALERRNHWEKTSHSLLVGAILFLMPSQTKRWLGSRTSSPTPNGALR